MEINLPIKVFLSHPSDDDTKKVKDILEKMSPQIELNMFPSTDYELDFTEAIRGSIENVDVLVAILNENGRKNQWVNQEVGIAVAKDIDIVILAEKEKILKGEIKEGLKGFANEKNKTIMDIESDDLEEEFLSWLEHYQEKHGVKILQRLILEDIKTLKRIIDAQKYKCRVDSKLNNLKQAMKNVEVGINRVLNDFKKQGFISLSEIDVLKVNIEGLHNPTSYQEFSSIGAYMNLIKALEKSKLFDKIDRYIELRELET